MADATGWRRTAFARLASERFNVAVIGGGITGAGIARDAALRGLRVALLEREDFASGTSSRSSRLVHGGVRYLEHGHLRLVFEASRERRILLRIAPHLVRPLAFTWPVYAGARISRAKLSLGLGLYDVLALFRNVARYDRLSRSEVLAAEPALEAEGLVGGARYFDASADDVRLTLANAIAAAEAGAVVLNHTEVAGLGGSAGAHHVLEVRDRITGERGVVCAAHVVNATGPWSDAVRALEAPAPAATIAGSSGAHIAVPTSRVGNRGAITMLHPVDARVLFTLPNGDLTIFGTTEQATAVGQVEARATREDVGYLLAAANRYFPNAGLGERDVLAAWAGIRPLARTLAAGDLGSASREHTIERGPRGVVHVTGGKLTTYRSMAAEVVDALTDSRAPRHRSTADSALPGGERAPSLLMEEASRVVRDDAVRARLVSAYGTRWRDVWNATSDPRARERLVPDHPVIGAELVYGVSNEMAMTLGDLLIRRTRLAFVMPAQGRALAPEAARWVKPLLGWDADAAGNAVADYDAEVERVFAVK